MSGPRRDDHLFLGLQERSLKRMLWAEGAWPNPLTMDDEDLRAARRKYRKLRRLAEKKGHSLDLLLLRRESDRVLNKARENIGKMMRYGSFDGCSYYVRVIREERQRMPGAVNPYYPSNYPYTRPVFRIRFEGILAWMDPHHTPLPQGTEMLVKHRQIERLPVNAEHRPLTAIEACRYNIYTLKDRIAEAKVDKSGLWTPSHIPSLEADIAKWEAILANLQEESLAPDPVS